MLFHSLAALKSNTITLNMGFQWDFSCIMMADSEVFFTTTGTHFWVKVRQCSDKPSPLNMPSICKPHLQSKNIRAGLQKSIQRVCKEESRWTNKGYMGQDLTLVTVVKWNMGICLLSGSFPHFWSPDSSFYPPFLLWAEETQLTCIPFAGMAATHCQSGSGGESRWWTHHEGARLCQVSP